MTDTKKPAPPVEGTPVANEKLTQCIAWLDEKKGQDILALDTHGINAIAESLIIVTAKSARQAQALADHVLAKCKETGYEYLGMEGYRNGQWILVDLNDILLNIFHHEKRDYYNLEGLWSKATILHDARGSEED